MNALELLQQVRAQMDAAKAVEQAVAREAVRAHLLSIGFADEMMEDGEHGTVVIQVGDYLEFVVFRDNALMMRAFAVYTRYDDEFAQEVDFVPGTIQDFAEMLEEA